MLSMGVGELHDVLAELKTVLGDRLMTTSAAREAHGRDESPLDPAPPDAVAYPNSTDEVAVIVAACNRRKIPVIPFGVGTSLEGHVLARSGGISLDLTSMNEIVAVRVDDMDVTVQPGVTRSALNERLARYGLFFPVDPGADATLGGMAATGASGTTTVRYGAMRENVISLEVVLADGRVIHTARRARKSSAGYDLTRLFVGSEGTLGVITELTLRVRGIPEAVAGAVCRFPSVGEAVQTATSIMQMAIPIARMEFVDELSIEAINAYSSLDYPVEPLLLLEFHGSPREVAEHSRGAEEIVAAHSGADYRSSVDAGERSELWRARHDHFYASRALRPGSRAVTTDVCVPLSSLARCIEETRSDIARLSLVATVAGHVGDGNFHVVILIDPDDAEEVGRADEMNHLLVERALAMDGTCTGEHGIGLRKMSFLERELPEAIEVMRDIKTRLDPSDILNPGKVLRADPDAPEASSG